MEGKESKEEGGQGRAGRGAGGIQGVSARDEKCLSGARMSLPGVR